MPTDLPPPPAALVTPADFDHRIRLNTIGFPPEGAKLATIAAEFEAYQLIRVSDGASVFQGNTRTAVTTAPAETDERVGVVDFSSFTTPGEYRLEVPGVGRSAPFMISADVWTEPYEVLMRGMYLWRCGTAVEATWRGITFRQAPCHLEDGWMDFVDGTHTQRKGTGGWHDAGDYNKYVVNAGVTVGYLFKALEHFGDRVRSVSHGIPESGDRIPDLLNELRWELDWLFTMQADDGKVYHKLSSKDFSYWGPAEKDPGPRYFSTWSTVSTAAYAAMLGEAARHFRDNDSAFAQRCLASAEKSWAVLEANPQPVEPDLSPFQTGGYTAKDTSHRLWAAAELWESTGDAKYLRAFEGLARQMTFTGQGPTWGDVQDFGFATYLAASRPEARDAALVERLTRELLKVADTIVATAQTGGYGRPLGFTPETWYWGANGTVAGQTLLLHLANSVRQDPRYRTTAEHALAFLFGRNFHGRSYVTGLGDDPPAHPHDRRGEPAWPGYLVGGGFPDGRSWKDEMPRYDLNEIAINWNGALIYAVAAFVPLSATPEQP